MGPAAIKRTDPGNGQRTDAGEQADDATGHSAGRCAGRRAFRRLGRFDVADVMRAIGGRQENGNLRGSEAGALKILHNTFGLRIRGGDAEDRFFRHIYFLSRLLFGCCLGDYFDSLTSS